MPKIVFIHRGGSSMASYRYRTEIPAKAVGGQINGGEADIVVFSKPCQNDLEILDMIDGQKVVVDFCDDHFFHPVLRPIYQAFVDRADEVVCPTEKMREIISLYGKEAHIIPDPYEFDEVEPHAEGDNLLWFGHEMNLPGALGLNFPKTTLVTGPTPREDAVLYSKDTLEKVAKQNNIALFPPTSEYKSPNRLVNALRLGLFPVCSWHPSYEEFKMCWVGDIYTGRRWAKHFKKDLNDLVLEGQEYIKKFSPKEVGRQWKDLLNSI